MNHSTADFAAELADLDKLHGKPHGHDYFAVSPVARSLCRKVAQAAGEGEFAVFAYGSLMWNPGFEPSFALEARLHGYSRQPCIYSTAYRGTPDRPGLVLGLDQGGFCDGIALGLPVSEAGELVRMLFDRELFQGVYYPLVTIAHPVGADRPGIRCLAFVANRASRAYAPPLPAERVRGIIEAARGKRGTCLEYWRQTAQHLDSSGIGWDQSFEV